MLRNHNHRTRDYLRSDRIVKRKRKRTLRKLIIGLILFLVLFVGSIFIARADFLLVNNILVDGNKNVSSEELISIAGEFSSSSAWYVFPRKNIFLYPTDVIETTLRDRYPRFSHVVVHRTALNEITIDVIERSPQALWCRDSSSECYSIDDQGYIYAFAQGTTTDLIKFSGGIEGTSTNPIGTVINSSSTFSDTASLLQGMKDRGLHPERVMIRNNHEFSVKVNPGGDIIFSDIRPLADSLDNLSAALQSAAFKSTSTPQTFEYIDTRFGNKIFFKLQK